MKMNPSHKKTLILVIVLLLCAAFASFWTARQDQKNDIRTVDLSTVKKTETFTLGEPGEQNTIQISPKGIGVIEADCRDQICVKQGIHSHGPEPIVCLPHKLSIRFISSNTDNSLDAVTGR